ncbi:MAG TPA: TonB-dependent receptor [Thermoanaerobaculia bacterium]|nr:TonB-dependent receptor [Thermoanaerobaculia bacterium]
MQKKWTSRGGPLVLGLLFALVAGPVFAQGQQTGSISGTVTLASGEVAPGILITATSPSLQGERSVTSQQNGEYILRGLPPGPYTIKFSLEGFKEEQTQVTVPLGGQARSDVRMTPQSVQETIVVTGEAATALDTTTIGANLNYKKIDELATPRDLSNIAALAPAVNTNAALPGQITISGGFAYDNLFLLNGVDINDSVFGNPNNLFIEDAIEETQVLSSGVSAEYGRFGGGVVNAITKSGGNDFTGSLRADLTNPSFRSKTPIEEENGTKRVSKNDFVYTGTLGGYVVKDKLWFFAAARSNNNDDQEPLFQTGIPFDSVTRDRRYEGKLTANLSDRHTFQASYIKNDTSQTVESLAGIVATPDAIISPSFPTTLGVVRYSGIYGPSFFGEAQYSQKKFEFVGFGGTNPDIHESPFLCTSQACLYNGPYFDATDGDHRDNKQFSASGSYFWNPPSLGSHDLKVGGEDFRNQRQGGNSQSSSNYVFFSDYVLDPVTHKPVLDNQGRAVPNFIPNTFQSFLVFWDAQRGSRNDVKEDAVYVNDRWRLGNHWSFNLGARYERATNTGTDNVHTVDSRRLMPRLGASLDPKGDGKYRLDATYAQYAGAYNLVLFSQGTNTGNPGYLYGPYIGPPGQGRDFTPGFDPKNYNLYIAGSPTQNIRFDKGASSPLVKEYTLSAGVQLSRAGFVKATYLNRKWTDLLEDFTSPSFGSIPIVIQGVEGPLADVHVFKNADIAQRDYAALLFQGRYPITDRWSVEGLWTHELKNDGNYESQVGQTFRTSGLGDYPELFSRERNFPLGHLSQYEADVAHLWTIYNLSLGKAGDLSLSLKGNHFSPLTTSLAAPNVPITSIQRSRDPGYASLPPTQTLYFGKRGSQEFNAWNTFDFAAYYQVPIFRSISPWLKVEVRNLLNDHTLIDWDTTVTPDPNSPKDSLGLPTGFIKGKNFGKARNNLDYPIPREFLFGAGFHF